MHKTFALAVMDGGNSDLPEYNSPIGRGTTANLNDGPHNDQHRFAYIAGTSPVTSTKSFSIVNATNSLSES